MEQIAVNKMDELTIKLLHYFITEQGYSPIMLQGAENEIWLEKLNGDYEIVRIVSNYIHNDEQFSFDVYKTNQIVKKIKQKTFKFKMHTLSIFVNLGENVNISKFKDERIDFVLLNKETDINKYKFLRDKFPTIMKHEDYNEEGLNLFLKLTSDINKKSEEEARFVEKIFKPKKPIVTFSIIIINLIVFLFASYLSGNIIDTDPNVLANIGGLTKGAPWWTNITAIFLHGGIIHFLFNNYAIYVIGSQIESFYGKSKYIVIYLFSGIIGNLLSTLLLPELTVGVGASGAILGLLGALLYFGFHYRVYLSGVLKSQIIPLVIVNLAISFLPGIGLYAHLGGFMGGIFISMALGVNKNESSDKINVINGIIISTVLFIFLVYMNYFI